MPVLADEIEILLERAASLALERLREQSDRDTPVLEWQPPERLREILELELPVEGQPLPRLLEEAEALLRASVRTGHVHFFNQLFNALEPAGLLGEWLTALANTSMYTYEVAPVFTLLEETLLARLGELAGLPGGEGVFSPGGSISNLMAVLAARHRRLPDARREGLPAGSRLAIFASAEAHYSIGRAAEVAGLGSRALHRVPVDSWGRMVPERLAEAVERARAAGEEPFLVVGTAGTTMAGAFDPLEEIAAIAERFGMWFHVDAAFGGHVLFSKRHRALMAGCERADSLAWNPHKTMAVPLQCSALLLRRAGELKSSFAHHADYLFHDNEEGRCDRGEMSLQCGRRVDSLKLWLAWRAVGDRGFEQRVDHAFALTAAARRMIEERPAFRLAREPQGCNILFHYLPQRLRGKDPTQNEAEHAELGRVNAALRERAKRDGRVMLNYSSVEGIPTLRLVLIHPELRETDLRHVFDLLEGIGNEL